MRLFHLLVGFWQKVGICYASNMSIDAIFTLQPDGEWTVFLVLLTTQSTFTLQSCRLCNAFFFTLQQFSHMHNKDVQENVRTIWSNLLLQLLLRQAHHRRRLENHSPGWKCSREMCVESTQEAACAAEIAMWKCLYVRIADEPPHCVDINTTCMCTYPQ